MKRLYTALNSAVIKVGMDKIAHFALSALLALVISLYCHNPFLSSSFVLVLGVIKEFADSLTGGTWDKKDFVADFAGIAVSLLVYLPLYVK